MNVRYILAQVQDLPLLEKMVEEFYVLDGHVFKAEAMRRALNDLIAYEHYGRLWLIAVDEVPAGYVAVTFGYSLEYQGRDAIVDEIYLREPYRGQGIGTQTFEFLETTCRQLGINALHLEVMEDNTKATAFYRRLGYAGRPSRFLHKWL